MSYLGRQGSLYPLGPIKTWIALALMLWTLQPSSVASMPAVFNAMIRSEAIGPSAARDCGWIWISTFVAEQFPEMMWPCRLYHPEGSTQGIWTQPAFVRATSKSHAKCIGSPPASKPVSNIAPLCFAKSWANAALVSAKIFRRDFLNSINSCSALAARVRASTNCRSVDICSFSCASAPFRPLWISPYTPSKTSAVATTEPQFSIVDLFSGNALAKITSIISPKTTSHAPDLARPSRVAISSFSSLSVGSLALLLMFPYRRSGKGAGPLSAIVAGALVGGLLVLASHFFK